MNPSTTRSPSHHVLANVILPALAAVSIQCTGGGDEAAPDATVLDARPEAEGPVELPLPPIDCEPTFESIQANIFVPTCGRLACHVDGDSALGLRLVDDRTLARLVGVAARCGTWTRLIPGDPDRSFLWHKLVESDPECGARMPWGYERLPDHALECIRRWIEDLAPIPAPDAGM